MEAFNQLSDYIMSISRESESGVQIDLLIARRAGVRTCGVTYGNGTRKELTNAGADWVIDDFGELKSL